MLTFSLKNLTAVIHSLMQSNNDDNVEEITASQLTESPDIYSVALDLDAPLNGQVEERIFHAIISNKQIITLYLLPTTEIRYVEELLRRAVPAMRNLQEIISLLELTEPEAARIMPILQSSTSLTSLGFCLGGTTDRVAAPLEKLIRESMSLERLGLQCLNAQQEDAPEPLSASAAASICNGIGTSTSLKLIRINFLPTNDDAVVKSFACAIANCVSLQIFEAKLNYQGFFHQVRKALLHVQAVKNFDLCFREGHDSEVVRLILNRDTPWKPLLADESLPLNYWPRILEKANKWEEETSHAPLDALYLLVKEKNHVLLQNVRRRKIRKRKRYQITF